MTAGAGVEFPGCDGLKAHSDGDVVVHALIDAMFGAAALGDIGSHFPDTDERWKGADSMELLAAAAGELSAAGWSFGNADITIVCEAPRIAGYPDSSAGGHMPVCSATKPCPSL